MNERSYWAMGLWMAFWLAQPVWMNTVRRDGIGCGQDRPVLVCPGHAFGDRMPGHASDPSRGCRPPTPQQPPVKGFVGPTPWRLPQGGEVWGQGSVNGWTFWIVPCKGERALQKAPQSCRDSGS